MTCFVKELLQHRKETVTKTSTANTQLPQNQQPVY